MRSKRKRKLKAEPRFYVIMTTLAIGIVGMAGQAIQTVAKPDVESEKIVVQTKEEIEQLSTETMENELPVNEVIEKGEEDSEIYAINLKNNPRIFSNFYNDVVSTYDETSVTALVNKNYQLSPTYKPDDLRVLNVTYSNEALGASQTMLRKEAASQAEKMFKQAKKDGITLLARSGYRSYKTQEQLYQEYVSRDGVDAADKYSARAGHSEHQLGLALDITSDSVNRELVVEFGETLEGIWLKKNAHRYGFIIRFPKGKEDLTGFQYEPWHVRYVGVDVAKEIYENDWLLEDYILMQKPL